MSAWSRERVQDRHLVAGQDIPYLPLARRMHDEHYPVDCTRPACCRGAGPRLALYRLARSARGEVATKHPNPEAGGGRRLPRVRRFIGVAELLAAVGLIFPELTGILPGLTRLAAFGMMIVLAGAIVCHQRRGETHRIPPVTTLFAMAAVVAYMRWQVLPL